MGMHTGSLNFNLSNLELGESLWMETTLEDCKDLQRRVTLVSRFQGEMKNMRFASQVYTCVSSNRLGDVRLAVRIQRIA